MESFFRSLWTAVWQRSDALTALAAVLIATVGGIAYLILEQGPGAARISEQVIFSGPASQPQGQQTGQEANRVPASLDHSSPGTSTAKGKSTHALLPERTSAIQRVQSSQRREPPISEHLEGKDSRGGTIAPSVASVVQNNFGVVAGEVGNVQINNYDPQSLSNEPK